MPPPLYSNSPHKPGSAEDMTYRFVEDSQARPDPNAGVATAAVAAGLAVVLTQLFKVPGLLWRGLCLALAYGPMTRWTIGGGVTGSLCGVTLSHRMNDEILRGQVRLVPIGLIAGFGLGLLRRIRSPRAHNV